MNHKERLTLFILPEKIYVFSMLKNMLDNKKQLFMRNFYALRTVVETSNLIKYQHNLLKANDLIFY